MPLMPFSFFVRFGLSAIFASAVLSLGAAEKSPLLKDLVGLNGHTVQFKPALYQPVGQWVRDYHPVEWDLGTNTSVPAPFPFAKNRVDWSQVYGSWRQQGWNIDATLMFESIPQARWRNLEADARAYGAAFAREFGPSGKRKLLASVEIGNEPGLWNDASCTKIFRAMGEGLRAGDPKLLIATCNLTTGSSGRYEKSIQCFAGLPNLFDVLTVHSYPQLEGYPTWQRSFPEDPKLARFLPDISALCAWRDAHAPGKPVWITEFGYDATTKPNQTTGDFARWRGVSDEQQAQWLVRSLLVFSTLPVQRAFIYFFNDADQPSVHASSGITRNFQPKPAFHALAHLQRTLGDYRFDRIVTNVPGRLRVQQYVKDTGRELVWAVWSPTGQNQQLHESLPNPPGKILRAEIMPLSPQPPAAPDFHQSAHTLEIPISESPTYLFFDPRP